MRHLRAVAGVHSPEPEPGTFRARDGQRADLFNVRHYPITAVCRVCQQPIRADSFFRPFTHEQEGSDRPGPGTGNPGRNDGDG